LLCKCEQTNQGHVQACLAGFQNRTVLLFNEVRKLFDTFLSISICSHLSRILVVRVAKGVDAHEGAKEITHVQHR
jgi:hypothetical protein